MYRMYTDQRLRFAYIQNELRSASAPHGSAIRTLYATFDPVAHARGVMDRVMDRVMERVMERVMKGDLPTSEISDSAAATMTTTTAKERVHSYFERSYADRPRVRYEMTTNGVYLCTVMHLDGCVMGIGESPYREVAEELGFVEAEKVVF